MRRILFGSITFAGSLFFLALAHAVTAAPDDPDRARFEFFEKRVRPLLDEHCYECHSAKAVEPKGGLRLDTRAGVLKGGKRGPAIVPGDADQSLMVQAVRYQSEDLQMPPKQQLAAEEIEAIAAWINMGAPDPRTKAPGAGAESKRAARELDERQRWVFQPPAEPAIPAVKNRDWPRGDVDRFLLAKLDERGLAPLRDADKRTLIRRATFDLIGLPPAPEEIDAFLADESPDAFARVVDRLLASPHYGERWGRFWLDLVRYADTAGDNSDYPVPQLYRYRNWVIDAFNRDMPYDEFIRQQLAGDLLPSETDDEKYSKIIATGYIASARRFGSVVDDYPQHLTIEDTIDNLGRTFLGLTINCARCHDHKFDPITTEDYYGLYGFFSSTRYPFPGIELDKVQRDLVPLVPPKDSAPTIMERDAQKSEFDAEVKRLEGEKSAADTELKNTEQAKKVADEAAAAKKADGETQDEKKHEPAADAKALEAKIAEIKKQLGELDKAIKDAKKRREDFEKAPLPFATAYAVADGKQIGGVRIQMKGDPKKLGDEVPRRFPSVLGGQTLAADEKGSGRPALAAWIADPQNPLTARVMVNRIWQHHLGAGIVSTPSDFGRQGRAPTHPELLDYLARRFVASGWSVKAMHRLVMMSRVYQLASRDERLDAANSAIDPGNEYLWKFSRRRLDAESIRDAMLAISGRLDCTPGGPHSFPDQRSWEFTQHKPFKAVYETNRRSVYLMTQRIQRHPYLAIFDGPDTNASTAMRVTSTTPLQALFLMNDQFVHEQAKHFASRLIGERLDAGARIDRTYVLAMGRPPTDAERAAGQSFLSEVRQKLSASGVAMEPLEQAAWESYVRAMLRLSEFVYID